MSTPENNPPAYQPGDVANQHVLGTDGVWRPVTAPPAAKPWYKKPLGIAAIIVGALFFMGVISGLAGGGDSDADAKPEPKAASSKPAAEKAKPKPTPVEEDKPMSEGEAKAKVGEISLKYSNQLVVESSAAGTALNSMEIDTAAKHVRKAASLAGQVVDAIEQDDELAASDFGRDTIRVYTQCQGAFTNGAEALETFDTDAMDASTAKMNTCSAGMQSLTDQLG